MLVLSSFARSRSLIPPVAQLTFSWVYENILGHLISGTALVKSTRISDKNRKKLNYWKLRGLGVNEMYREFLSLLYGKYLQGTLPILSFVLKCINYLFVKRLWKMMHDPRIIQKT